MADEHPGGGHHAFTSFAPPDNNRRSIFDKIRDWFRPKGGPQFVTGYSSGFAEWRSKTWRGLRAWIIGGVNRRRGGLTESSVHDAPIAQPAPTPQESASAILPQTMAVNHAAKQYSALPGWYAQWSLDSQMLFWFGMAFLLAGCAVGVAYVLPALGLITAALSLPHMGLLAALVAVGTLYVGLWLDGLWALREHRPPRAQFYRSLLFTLLSLAMCLLVGAWFLPFKVWTAFIATLFPSIAKWAVGWKVAVLVLLPLGWAMLAGGLSSAFAKVAKYCRSGQSAWWRLGHCFQGMSWGVLLVGASVPAIFMGYYFATQALVTSTLHFLSPWLGAWTTPACVAGAPLLGGMVMSFLNFLWRGAEKPAASAQTARHATSAVLSDGGHSQGTKKKVLCEICKKNKVDSTEDRHVPWDTSHQESDSDTDGEQTHRLMQYTQTPGGTGLGNLETPQRIGATPIEPETLDGTPSANPHA